jgi:hypothetical protein
MQLSLQVTNGRLEPAGALAVSVGSGPARRADGGVKSTREAVKVKERSSFLTIMRRNKSQII